jgi:hypothetical protein
MSSTLADTPERVACLTAFDRTTVAEVPATGSSSPATITLDEGWSSLQGLHGGYLAAVAVRAAEAALGGRAVRTVATSFLRSGRPGPASIELTERRNSRSLTTLDVSLGQAGGPVLVSRVTGVAGPGPFGAPGPSEAGSSWDEAVAPVLAPRSACIPLDPPPGIGHFDQADAVIDPADVPFTSGPRARIAGYVRPLEPRPVDAPWLTMILDWFPPSPFSRHDAPVGGISVDFVAHIHRTLPFLRRDEWLVGEFTAEVSSGGLALERGRIFGPDGRLLAESFHTRWTR